MCFSVAGLLQTIDFLHILAYFKYPTKPLSVFFTFLDFSIVTEKITWKLSSCTKYSSKTSMKTCKCLQVKPSGKSEANFFLAIPFSSHVSDRSRSILCIIIIFIIIIFSVGPVVHGLSFCRYLSNVTPFYTRSLGFHSSHNIFECHFFA